MTLEPVNDRFALCVRLIDEANAADPACCELNGEQRPRCLVEGERAQSWLERLHPNASDALKLAARAHHVRRWEVPRDSYPLTRVGYHAWRTRLYGFHGEVLGAFMERAGYPVEDVTRAQEILSKQRIKVDPECQAHEDAVSLAFLEVRLAEFAPRISDEQLLRALRRTWAKMSPDGHAAALELAASLPAEMQALLRAALAQTAD